MYATSTLEIYLDLLFILNVTMDYFIFWMVSKITYQRVTRVRLGFGALIGGILYCLVVVTPFLRTVNIIIYLIALPLMPIQIIFKPKKIKEWLQIYVIANITAMIIGGISYGIFYWIQDANIIANIYEQTQNNFSVGMLGFSILASYIIIQSSRYYLQKRNTQVQRLYTVKIVYNNESVVLEALLDTGNKVYDPITKEPVIIAEYPMLESLLPLAVKESYMKSEDITSIIQDLSDSEFGKRIRIIPYHSLGNPNGILLGFKADGVYIKDTSGAAKSVKNVIIGIYKHNLSKESTYHALLHGDLINH